MSRRSHPDPGGTIDQFRLVTVGGEGRPLERTLAGDTSGVDELRYSVLRLLESNPDVPQRDLARAVGVSLGKINYCLRALIEKGLVKTRNFKNNKNKIAYTYYVTPMGVAEKAQMAYEFLSLKLREIEELRREIDRVREQHAVSQAMLMRRESDA